MIDQLIALVRTLTIGQRIGILFGSLFSVLLLVGIVMWAGQPQMVTAFSGLDMASASTITAALDSAGIAYDLADGGATIKTAAADAPRAKIAANDAGFSGSSSDAGWSSYDNQGFGASEAELAVKHQRALQGDLTAKIKKIAGVADASVTIVEAKTGTLSTSDQPASASVWVKMGGGGQPSGALVGGIVNLVSGAVGGLSADNVTVVDASGNTLHGPGTAQGDAVTIKATIERSIADKVTSLLNATLGAGNAQVAVTADVDLQKITEQVTKVQQGAPTSAQDTVELQGQDAAAAAGGIAGTNSNVAGITYPNASASASPAPSASIGPDTYVKRTTTVNWANTQSVQQIVTMPGTVKRVSIAVLVNQTAADAQQLTGDKLAALTPAIVATAGLVNPNTDGTCGDGTADCLQVLTVPFYQGTTEATSDIMGTVADVAPTAGGFLLGFLLLFLVWRNMRGLRSRAEEMQLLSAARSAMPALAAGGSPAAAAALAGLGYAEVPEIAPPPSQHQKALDHLRDMAFQEPETVAKLLSQYLSEDEKKSRR